MTVLFTDLVGSTALRQSLGDDRADALRRQHDRVLREAIAAHSGNEVKNTGDGLMVVFGSSADAVSAAVEMQQGVARFNRRATAPMGLRIGVSAGDVVWEDDDCFGTPVVEASRLCNAADGGQILTAEVVRLLAGSRGGHRFEPVGPLELKGLTQPLPACAVSWDAEDAHGTPLPGPLIVDDSIGFVGRTDERRRLEFAWKEAAGGGSRVVLVSGEPGIGKTRLVSEVARAAHREGATVLFGRCDEDPAIPYQPFVEALDGYVTHTAPDRLLAHAGRHGGDLARMLPRLAERVPGLPEAMKAEADVERHHLFEAVRAFLAAIAQDAPVVFVIDDLHWAAKPTLLLLRHLTRDDADVRGVLMLATYRDTDLGRGHPLADALGDLRRSSDVERLDLQGLDAGEVGAVIELAAGHELDDATASLVHDLYEETEGNPFFLGQTLRHLVETGVIVSAEGRWVRRPSPSGFGIPEGVREVIGRRLSRLSDETNEVLSTAAVIGREFDVDVLTAASALDKEVVLDALEVAEQGRLVLPVPQRRRRYSFVHALVRSTLYEELATTRRLRMHRRVGLVLEERNADDRYVDDLARHFGEAAALGETERALEYGSRAARRALERLAYEEAASSYERVLAVLDPDEVGAAVRARLNIDLGSAVWSSGDRASARRAFDVAAELARQADDAELLALAAIGRGGRRGWTDAGAVDDALISLLEEALDRLPVEDSPLRAMVIGRLATELYFAPGSHERRLRLTNEALTMARGFDDQAALAAVLMCAHFGLWVPGNEDIRLAIAKEMVAVGEALGDVEVQMGAWGWLATNLWEHGDADGARAAVARLTELAHRLRMPDSLWMAGVSNTCIALFEGRLDDALAMMDETLAWGERTQTATAIQMYGIQLFAVYRSRGGLEALEPMFLAMVDDFPLVPAWRCGMIYLYAELGWLDKARVEFERLAEEDFALPFDSNWGIAMSILCFAAFLLDDRERAAVLYERFRSFEDKFVTVGMPAEVIGPARHPLALVLATLDRWEEAETQMTTALTWLDSAGARKWAARVRVDFAALLRRRGRPEDEGRIEALLADARLTSEELGFARLLERIDAFSSPSR